MKEKDKLKEKAADFRKKLERFRIPLLVLLLGMILLMLPGKSAPTDEIAQPTEKSAEQSLMIEEERLSRLLSQVKGAGEVQVMLSIRSAGETVYQQDQTKVTAQGGDQKEEIQNSTVLYGTGSGKESALIRKKLGPVYEGAIVLCQGADDPTVKLALVQAVSGLTGLGADRITVVGME